MDERAERADLSLALYMQLGIRQAWERPLSSEGFHEALEGLLGAGCKVVEKLIAENLYKRLGLKIEEREDWTLVDYANHAKEATEGA